MLFRFLWRSCIYEVFLLYFSPPGGGLVFDVRITKPKPSLSLRCRVTSKHSGREGWRGWTAFGTSTRGTLGEVLTRADATCCGCWLLSSCPSPSDKWQSTETCLQSRICSSTSQLVTKFYHFGNDPAGYTDCFWKDGVSSDGKRHYNSSLSLTGQQKCLLWVGITLILLTQILICELLFIIIFWSFDK